MALAAPLLTMLAAACLVVAGLFAWKSLPIEAYPELSNPQVRIISLVPGKGPEEVEGLVTIPLEKELYGIPGQTALRSLSLFGLSVIIVTFDDGTSTFFARQQTIERMHLASLPEGVEPTLEPDVGSLREIYRYALSSPYYSSMGLKAIQQWELEKVFRQIPGVIGVVSEGGPTKVYQVNVDPLKLKARNISLAKVAEAVEKCNATTGGGFLEHNGNAVIVRELGLIKGKEDLAEVVVSTDAKGTPIRLKDLADISIGQMVRRGQVGKDNEDDVVEGIVLLRRGENPSKVLKEIKKRLPDIVSRLPPGVKFHQLYDREWLVKQTLSTVGTNVAWGIGLVVLLLALFLFDLSSSLITACVIPLSMLIAFISLCLLGVPANLLSLGAIDFGILVDSAVVMVENILRRLSEEGQELSPVQRLALLQSSANEVAAPIVFGIIVILATFGPIFSFQGVEGKLFRPLAATMVSALIGAGLLALALVPVLCSFFMIKKPLKERQSPIVLLFRAIYKPTLKWALKLPWLVIALSGAAIVWSTNIFLHTGSEFLPHLEEGNIWLRATVKPSSVTLGESARIAGEIRQKLLKFPEVKQVLSQVGGPDDGTDPAKFADQEFYVDLKAPKEWRSKFKENKESLISQMRSELSQIPGVSYYFTQYIQTTLDEALSGVQGSLVAKVLGPDLAELDRLTQQAGKIMSRTPGIVDVIVDPLLGQPQFVIEIDRKECARYGLNEQDLKDLTELAIGGRELTKIIEGEKRFAVIVRLAAEYRSSEQALGSVMVDTPTGAVVSLSQLASLKELNGATQIWRDGGFRMGTVRANVRGRDLATAVKEAQEHVRKELKLPTGYHIEWSGEFQRQKEASEQMALILPVTLLIIILILYLSCGSVLGAFVMFSVVPLASIGAVIALRLTNTYFSIAAGVGLIALFGLAVKNGILLVSFVNELRHGGLELYEAIYKGAVTRMRPVLMTATIAAFGLLPAAVSTEIGSQTQKPFAIVIIGGLISCTVLSLYVLPALYLCIRPGAGRRNQLEPNPREKLSASHMAFVAGQETEEALKQTASSADPATGLQAKDSQSALPSSDLESDTPQGKEGAGDGEPRAKEKSESKP